MRKFEFHSYGIQNEEYHVINTEEYQNFVMLNPNIAFTKQVEKDLFLMSKAPELLENLKEMVSYLEAMHGCEVTESEELLNAKNLINRINVGGNSR